MILPIYIKDTDYILSCTTTAAQVAAIDAIKAALLVQYLTMASQGEPINEYTLSDGQTHIKASYKTLADIDNAIRGLDYMRNRLTNNGRRSVRCMDTKNFIGRRGF